MAPSEDGKPQHMRATTTTTTTAETTHTHVLANKVVASMRSSETTGLISLRAKRVYRNGGTSMRSSETFLSDFTDPDVAAPWVQARETVNSYLVVRRTETGRFKAHTITHGHPKAYPMAPFGPRHPHTYTWE